MIPPSPPRPHAGSAAARGRRAALATLLGGALLLHGTRRNAEAHATLLSSEPAAGSTLPAGPARVRLVFSEPIEPSMGGILLTDGRGRSTRLAAQGDPHDVHALLAPVEQALERGVYRLTWRIVSADGHPVEGSFVFSVAGEPPTATTADSAGRRATTIPPAPPPPPSPIDTSLAGVRPNPMLGPSIQTAPLVPAVLRGAGVGALMALGGLLFFMTPRWGTLGRYVPPRARHLATWLAVAAPVLLAAHLAAWLAHTSPSQRLDTGWAATALSSGVGRVELWRIGFAALALWALVLARRTRLALLFAGMALLVSGAVGHSAALHSTTTIPTKALHLLAGAVWIGGILWLLSFGRGDPGGGDEANFANEAEGVSSLALVAVIAVVLSGVVQTALFLGSPLDLVRSAYGVTVLAKVAGFVALAAFGAHYRRRVLPALAADPGQRTPFARLLTRELAVMGAVVLLGGLLAYLAPPGHAGSAAAAHGAAHPPTD